MQTLNTLATYLLRILPGLALVALFLLLIRPQKELRVVLYILAFVLMRDAMTPLGLWSLGATRGFLWIRLRTDPLFLIIFGVLSLGLVAALYLADRDNREHLVWLRGNRTRGALIGITGSLVVVAPFLLGYSQVEMGARGGPVSRSLLLPILIFALLGNLFEETLFRGYVLSYFEQGQPPLVAGIASGLTFAVCHTFLAITVTGVGAPLLVFTLWEGIIAGLVGAKYGVLPATLTHGGAVFLLSSGL